MEIRLVDISIDKILRAYKGKPGCMCGCLGRYYTTTLNQKLAGERRGYEVPRKECKDEKVIEIRTAMKEALASNNVKSLMIDSEYVCIDTNDNVRYALYFV